MNVNVKGTVMFCGLRVGSVLVGAIMLLSACGSYNDVHHTPSIQGDLVDNAAWYTQMPQTLLETRVSVPVPNDYECKPYNDLTLPARPCTLEDVLGDNDSTDDYEPILHVHYENDEFLDTGVNASFKQKGKTTRRAAQKSFRIKLDSKTHLYRDERTIQLGKHPYDKSRVRNKLFFELFQDIPNFNSLRTRFVHLEVNGVDYGLYDHIEKGDKLYLKNHGYSEDDNLYKMQNFAFRLEPGLALDEKGDPVNPEAFDAIATIANGKDTAKFIQMIKDADAAKTDEAFMKVFDKYFNRNNYITWMAINIVSGNKDTTTQNFFLLNPKYSDTFYFLPWDYDGAGRPTYKYAKWELGIGTWWSVPLHKKFLRIKKNRDDLDKMVYTIRNKYMNDTIVHQKMDRFRPIVEPFILRSPDGDHLPYNLWKDDFETLRNTRIAENVQNYESQKGVPMPFWQSVTYDNGVLDLGWEEAVDLEGDEVMYTVEVTDAQDANFTRPFLVEHNITKDDSRVLYESWGNFTLEKNITLTPAHYYMKVTAYEVQNPQHYQIAFDKAVKIDDTTYFGLLEFKVE